jgi:hypothetical protein
MDGFKHRATDLVSKGKAQPNGPLFEMLVAGAYARAGAKVAFRPEKPGEAKSYDLDVELKGRRWAVECKRMEGGEYHEQERERMRALWKLPCFLLVQEAHSTMLVVNFKVDRVFKERGTTVKPFERSTALVTTGVFALSRNKMYLGMVLILLGVAVLLGTAAPFAVFGPFALWLDVRFIRTEERMLAETFGDDWLSYRSRVRRWL